MTDRVGAGGRGLARRLDRRVVLRATAAVAGMALLGGAPPRSSARGPGILGTIAGEWVEADHPIATQTIAGAEPPPRVFQTDVPFYAVAPHWSGEAEPGATVELSLSADGESWTEPVRVRQADAEGGRPDRDGRRFGQLVATQGASFVGYRTLAPDGAPTELPGLAFTYIDATPGPRVEALAQPATDPAFVPPPIVSRAAWGADEGLRFGRDGEEIWPPEYAPVEHVVIHHTDTATFADPLIAIRSIYYYHAVTRGWGDIGYNYLVDFLGNVYEGRVGGETVVAGHAAGFNEGTAGIGTIGRFDFEATTPETQAALVWITAWAGRALDPFAAKPFRDIASLPTICAHRDLNPTACPGDLLYDALPAIRDYVDAVLIQGAAPTPATPTFLPGDAVVTASQDVALRDGPGTDFPVLVRMSLGEPLTVSDGPATSDGALWYAVQGATMNGWTRSDLLAPVAGGPSVAADPPPAPVPATQPVPFSPGDPVRVVDGALNLHAAPGLSSTVVTALPDGTLLTVLDGPASGDGLDWYRVDSPSGPGWCAAPYLQPT